MTTDNRISDKKTDRKLRGLEREVMELTVLYEIAMALNSSTDLQAVLTRILQVLHEKMGMERGTISLLDSRGGEIGIHVAHGLGPEQIERGRYRLGEGITGKVVAAGKPIVVPNLGKEPLFLDRTRARQGLIKRGNISFVCVPIKIGEKTIGALSVDRLFNEGISFEEDIRLLTIISSTVAQAVRIHQMICKDRERLQDENIQLKHELKKKFHPANIIGESKRMADVYASVELVSQSSATVLLRGESGTGKELVAHAVHYNSDRAEGPFIKISCAALPETLLESELFGYEKGAFTGAAATKRGRFELAHNGTLFLDEIGDIPLSTQVKLLRVLQEKEFERLGGTETIRTNIRLITATNKDLEKEVREGRFREDLYYRFNVVPIFLPSLRERKEDIPLLVKHFLEKANPENKKNVRYVSDEAMKYLMSYSWPGNVRELENAIERAVVLCKGDTLEASLFPIPGSRTSPVLSNLQASECSIPADAVVLSGDLLESVKQLEIKMIKQAMVETDGNQRKAAKRLGVTERILGYKVKTYGLK